MFERMWKKIRISDVETTTYPELEFHEVGWLPGANEKAVLYGGTFSQRRQ